MPADSPKPKDNWDKWDIVAKMIIGLSIPLLGLLVTYRLEVESENNREAEFQLNLVQARETADTDIRAKMFDFLLTRYFTIQSGPISTIEDFQTRRMVLRLLLENFQEHFSTKSLYAHLYQQAQYAENKASSSAEKKQWQKFEEELIQVGRNATSEQLISLAPVDLPTADILVPLTQEIPVAPSSAPQTAIETKILRVALYSRKDLSGGEFAEQTTSLQPDKEQADNEKSRYSIKLSVKQIKEDAATVDVLIYEDKYRDKKFDAEDSPELSRFRFDASYFSTPYTDNIRLPNGIRFAVIYKGCVDWDALDKTYRFDNPNHRLSAQFRVVTFTDNFTPQKDRPDIDQMIESMRKKNQENGVFKSWF